MVRKTILIIDDSTMIIKALRSLLGEEKYNIHCAENGAAGVKEYARVKPDLVITDMEMPVMSGEKVIARIKAVCPFQVVLAMSSRSSNEKKAMTAGATKFLTKPVMPEDVISFLN